MAKLSMLDEAKIILSVCHSPRVNLPATILPPPASFETTRIRVYYLDGLDEYDPAAVVKKIQGSVEAMLNKAWNRGKFFVRVVASLPIRIEVPRSDEEIAWQPLWDVIKSLKGKGRGNPLVIWGETYLFDRLPERGEKSRESQLAVTNLAESSTAHVLLAAATGNGKSRLMKNVIISMAAASSPADVRMIVFDPKGVDFRGFHLPHLACKVLHDADEALLALRGLNNEMDRRKKIASSFPEGTPDEELNRAIGPYIVAFIDELADIVGECGPEAETIIIRLLQKARGMKINLFLATQRPAAATIAKIGEMRTNLTVRVVGAIAESEHAKQITGMAGSIVQANTLTKGDFILVVNSKMRRFHAFGLESEAVPGICTALFKTWGSVNLDRLWRLDLKPVAATPAQLAQPVPAMAPAGRTDETSQRHNQIVQAIKRKKEKDGEWPSANAVRTYHKEKFNTALNGNTAQKLLDRAKGAGAPVEMQY